MLGWCELDINEVWDKIKTSAKIFGQDSYFYHVSEIWWTLKALCFICPEHSLLDIFVEILSIHLFVYSSIYLLKWFLNALKNCLSIYLLIEMV